MNEMILWEFIEAQQDLIKLLRKTIERLTRGEDGVHRSKGERTKKDDEE